MPDPDGGVGAHDLSELVRRDFADGVRRQVVSAVIDHQDAVLLLRRASDDFRGGAWELPAGKVEAGEDLLAALRREIAEETGLVIDRVTGYLGSFDYPADRGRQHVWSVTVTGGEDIRVTEHDAYAWIAADYRHPVEPEIGVCLARHFENRA